MHYYIDGYNLLFRMIRAGDNLQSQRAEVIRDLSTKIQFIGLNATIVFDAQYQVGGSAKTHVRQLEILFTAQGETADECIISALKATLDPRQETVVTSDKKLAWRARRKTAHSLSVEEFMDWLNRRYKNKRRQLKTKAPPAEIIKPPPKIIVNKQPACQLPAEECFDYYLAAFERKMENQPMAAPQKLAKKKKLLPRPVQDNRSDFERWLEAFEKGSEDNGIN